MGSKYEQKLLDTTNTSEKRQKECFQKWQDQQPIWLEIVLQKGLHRSLQRVLVIIKKWLRNQKRCLRKYTTPRKAARKN